MGHLALWSINRNQKPEEERNGKKLLFSLSLGFWDALPPRRKLLLWNTHSNTFSLSPHRQCSYNKQQRSVKSFLMYYIIIRLSRVSVANCDWKSMAVKRLRYGHSSYRSLYSFFIILCWLTKTKLNFLFIVTQPQFPFVSMRYLAITTIIKHNNKCLSPHHAI